MTTEPDQAAGERVDARAELTRSLREYGALAADWAPAFDAVDRAAFLPELIWPFEHDTGASHPVDRRTDPDGWERAAYADVPVTTQWDDGAHDGPEPGRTSTSSASMPALVARMLTALDVFPGARVLEIGTGTGWNAGLLAARLGDERVVTVEVDEAVAARARANLRAAGLHPEVVCRDGRDGWPDGAPYDRVIVTAGVRQLPTRWLRQTRPGGVILAPWGTHYGHEDALVRLTVAEDGSASGSFLRTAGFMKLRAQRLDWELFAHHVGDYPGEADTATTTVPLSDLGVGRPYAEKPFLLGLLMPECTHLLNTHAHDSTVWFFDRTEGSRAWASVVYRDDAEPGVATVHQSGERRLWDEVTRALAWWREQGEPPLAAFGLTVTADGTQRPWLGDPTRPVPSFR
ncbi:methyltransferase domain-containing protein [Streptomyces sedi]|uniref:Protein-L-isoaspartate O-methyltransferase n=1 Tax=Streptomyces sedi TaxID=555059 RepID=A0A5C4V098_9ACTN|nr:methyltransferase domain-containing protein [Streptomyces sedi]TNM29440.1 methyltransferase domain-containing protein [Streptomyces sedi]